MPRTVKFKYEYQKMKPWQYESLYAPFNFPIYKTAEEIKLEEDDYLKDSYPIFTYDNVITKQKKKKMLADSSRQIKEQAAFRKIIRHHRKSRYHIEHIFLREHET